MDNPTTLMETWERSLKKLVPPMCLHPRLDQLCRPKKHPFVLLGNHKVLHRTHTHLPSAPPWWKVPTLTGYLVTISKIPHLGRMKKNCIPGSQWANNSWQVHCRRWERNQKAWVSALLLSHFHWDSEHQGTSSAQGVWRVIFCGLYYRHW